jgi:hypothetical protein
MASRYRKGRLGNTKPSGAPSPADLLGTELDDLAGEINPNIKKTPLFQRVEPRFEAPQPATANYSENELQLNDAINKTSKQLNSQKTWLQIIGSVLGISVILLALLTAACITMWVLTADGLIAPSYPCVHCDGNRLVLEGGLTVNGGSVIINVPTHLNNVTYVNQLMLLNTTNDVYFNLFTFLTTLNGGNGSLSCAQCAPNGTLIIDNDMIVEGNSYFDGNVTTYGNLTAYQISLLNTTNSMFFDLFTFLNNLQISSLPCAYCSNGTLITTGDLYITGNTTTNGTITVNYIELLNTTSDTYFDVFTAINDLTRLFDKIDNCTVIEVCGPASNISAAFAKAASKSPSSSNNVGIEFCPGTYVIPNGGGPIVIPAYVSIYARVSGSVTLTPSNSGNAVFALHGQNKITGFQFMNGLSAPYLLQTAYVSGGITVISQCTMTNGFGLYQSNNVATLETVVIQNCELEATAGSTSILINYQHEGTGIVDGVNLRHVPGAFGTGIRIGYNGLNTQITDCSFIGLSSAMIFTNMIVGVYINTIYASDISYAIINTPTITSGLTEIYANGITSDNSYGPVARTYAVASTEVFTFQFGDVSHYNCTEEPKPKGVSGVYIDVAPFEPAVERVLIDQSVGVPEQPHESWVGTGKVTMRRLEVYLFSGGVYSNIGTTLCAGTPVSLGTASGNILYVGVNLNDQSNNPAQHYALQFETTIASSGGTWVIEYWDNLSWTPFPTMMYETAYPYTPSPSLQVPFETTTDTTILYSPGIYRGTITGGVTYFQWQTSNPPSLSSSLYWIRYRITSLLSTAPTISKVSYVSHSQQIDYHGSTLYYGVARPSSIVNWGSAAFAPVPAASTGAFNVSFSGGAQVEFANAVFPDSVASSRGFNFEIPPDCDTSASIFVSVKYVPSNGASGTIDFSYTYVLTELNDVYSGLGTTVSNHVTIGSSANKQLHFSFAYPVGAAQVYSNTLGDSLSWMILSRNGASGSDTFAGDIQIVSITAYYTKRMEGVPVL